MTRVRKRTRIAHRTIAGEAAIVTVDDRKLHILNEVGSAIFNWLSVSGDASLEDLSQKLAETFEVTRDQAMVDCRRFCAELVDRRILEWAE